MIAPTHSPSPDDTFIRIAEIAKEANQSVQTVCNWIRYHGWLKAEPVLGVQAVRRTDYEQFKLARPELFRPEPKPIKRRKRRKAPAN